MNPPKSRVLKFFSLLLLVLILGAASSCSDTAGPASGGPFIGNSETRKFHLPSCTRLPTVNRIGLSDCDAVISGGFSPCAYCEPSCG